MRGERVRRSGAGRDDGEVFWVLSSTGSDVLCRGEGRGLWGSTEIRSIEEGLIGLLLVVRVFVKKMVETITNRQEIRDIDKDMQNGRIRGSVLE